MKRTACLTIALCLLLLASPARSAAPERTFILDVFLRENINLKPEQIELVHHGKALATVLDSSTPDEVFVFGAIYIQATPASYLRFANNLDELRKLPSYLAVRQFSDPPRLSDLDGFTIEADDLKELRHCKPGHCEVQLPAMAIEQFRESIDWSSADAEGQANRLAQQMTLQALLAYQKGGNTALGIYRDKDHPAGVAETFQTLLQRLKALPVYLPDLNGLLLDYPAVNPPNAPSTFYWEKVNFGLKPTLRLVQQVIYRGGTSESPVHAVALKQLFASHYFQGALDLTVCARDAARPNERGFYLITVKASRQAGLTGFKGGIVRKVAVGRTRSSLEHSLTVIKQRLEASAQ